MNPSDQIINRRNEIKNLIATARLEDAIKRTFDFVGDFDPNIESDVIDVSRGYYELRAEQRGNTIAPDILQRQTSQLVKRLFMILEDAGAQPLQIRSVEQSSNAQIIQAATQPTDTQTLATILLPEEPSTPPEIAEQAIVLEAKKIEKRYTSTNFSLQLEEVTLRLGELTGLIGENATGKTTFLRLLAGDLACDSGDLQYPLFQKSSRLNWNKLKPQIAYVPQELSVWRGTLLDNIRYEAAIHGIKGAANRQAVDYIIQRLGLAEHIEKNWQQLSGGYKLRFALAKALVWKAQLLIIDEPLANLDIKTQITVLNDLRHLSQSRRDPIAVLISSQHLHEIEAVADQMLFMRGGQLQNLGRVCDFGANRRSNCFEFACALPATTLVERLANFDHQKLWHDGRYYVLQTARSTNARQLLHKLDQEGIPLTYFRDISTSIKTKFYEATD